MGEDMTVLRERLVDQLVADEHLHTPRVEQAFRRVPRHLFLPGSDPAEAYLDRAIPTKWSGDGQPISSSSQPAIMARMLEQLQVERGQRVLEIGAGTGYNAALLAHLVGSAGTVTTIDIDDDTVDSARQHLRAAGLPQVRVVSGDGAGGWPAEAPYDRIIVTAAAADLPPAWSEQLAAHGRLVLPLVLGWVQRSVAFTPQLTHLASVSIEECGFMPLRGQGAGAAAQVLGFSELPGLFVHVRNGRTADTSALHAALQQPGPERPTGVQIRQADLWGGLGLWLAVHEPDAGRLVAQGSALEAGLVPPLLGSPAMIATVVLVGGRSMAALAGRASTGSFPLSVRAYGPDGARLAEQLAAVVRAWGDAGRPSTGTLRIRAYPAQQADSEVAPGVLVAGRTRLLIDW